MVAATPETVRAALAVIPADDRDLWLRMGMAVHSEFPGEDGLAMFDAWSQGADNYDARAVRDTWRSFKPGKVTIATLWHEAKARGYRRPKSSTPRATGEAEVNRGDSPGFTLQRSKATEADAATQRAHDAAARRANAMWEKASKTPTAPYLAAKGIKSLGARSLPDGALLVEMRAGPTYLAPLVNLQIIRPAKAGGFEKRFLRGGRMAGTMYLFGGFPVRSDCIVITEGFATAASVFEATGLHVAVAWNAGNLQTVALALRAEYPDKRLMIAGDDDRTTKGNPGRTKAEAAARAVGGAAVFPQGLADGLKDWNDLHQSAGLDAVRAQIEAAIQAAQATQSTDPLQTPPEPEKNAPAGRLAAALTERREFLAMMQSAQSDAAKREARRDAYRVEDGALWFDPPDDGSGGPARPVRVCGELRVTALARDAHDGGAALRLEFDTPFGLKSWLMPLAMLAGDGTAYRAELLSRGFMVPTDAKRRALLTAYLQSRRPPDLVRIVDRVGWHAGGAFVLPRETLGDDGGERILFQSETATESTISQRGTADQWRERIGRLCVGNPRLMFFVSLALAGPLLMWAKGTDGGIVHLVGDSSSGKTTVLRVGASVYGGPEFLKRWRATENGLEGVAAQHSDLVLFLDESGQMEGRAIGEASYMLANGQGKSRATRTGAARPCQTWRLLIGSTGEVGITEMMGEANKRTRAGQELRMIDLPADAGAGLGVFEERHEFESPGALAQHLARATAATYGTVGRAWLEFLTEGTEGTEGLGRALRGRMDVIEARFVPEMASGQVQRVGRRFALVAAAGEMATEAGLTGWPAGAATAAAHRCLNAWIEARPGGIGMSETAQMLRQLRAWFGLHGDARFVEWDRADDDHAPKTMNRAGWRRKIKTTTGLEVLTGWEWFVLPDVFRTEACKGFSDRAALRLLHELGHLHRESPKGFGCRASPPGADKVNVYRIKSSILSEGEE